MKILLVEDEQALAKSIGEYLHDENYLCEFAFTAEEAFEKIRLYEYECILLDLMLPGGNGLDILRELKAINRLDGVIIISAKNSIPDKIEGLQIGADDYLSKPFHLPELAARIFSVIRRKHFTSNNLIEIGEIRIDLLAKTVWVSERPLPLTKKEFDLLLYFISNRKRVISKMALAEHISGDVADLFDSYDFVYAHIKNLKKKLNDAGCTNYIKTLYGSGYKWDI